MPENVVFKLILLSGIVFGAFGHSTLATNGFKVIV